MQNVLIVIHLLIVVALVGVVLLQRSEGGGLGMGSGGGGVGGFMTGRGQANALTRATAILAGLFFVTSLVLAVLATQGRTQRSIIDSAPPPAGAPAAPSAPSAPSAPNAGGGFDQLQRMQNQGGSQPPQPGTPTR
jgi:preprotein translocase subunit SecG